LSRKTENDMDIIQQIISKLPSEINITLAGSRADTRALSENYSFSLHLTHDGVEMRLIYLLNSDTLWINPFLKNLGWEDHACGFLYLVEGIECLLDLEKAVEETYRFLQVHNLL